MDIAPLCCQPSILSFIAMTTPLHQLTMLLVSHICCRIEHALAACLSGNYTLPWLSDNRINYDWLCLVYVLSSLRLSRLDRSVMFLTCPIVHTLAVLWIRYFENKSTSFAGNWQWFTGQGNETLSCRVRRSKVKVTWRQGWPGGGITVDPFGQVGLLVCWTVVMCSSGWWSIFRRRDCADCSAGCCDVQFGMVEHFPSKRLCRLLCWLLWLVSWWHSSSRLQSATSGLDVNYYHFNPLWAH